MQSIVNNIKLKATLFIMTDCSYKEKHIKLKSSSLGSSLEKETVEKAEELPKEDIKPVHEEKESEPTKETDEKEKKKNEKVNEDKAANKTEKADKEKKATIVQIKEPISAEEVKLGSQILSGEKLAESRDK